MFTKTEKKIISKEAYEKFELSKSSKISLNNEIFKWKPNKLISDKIIIEYSYDEDLGELRVDFEYSDEFKKQKDKDLLHLTLKSEFFDNFPNENEESPLNKKNLIKLGVMLVIVGILIYFLVTIVFSDWETTWSNFTSIFTTDWSNWFIPLFFQAILLIGLQVFVIYYFVNYNSDKKLQISKIIPSMIVSSLLNWLTPFWGLGFAFLIWDIPRRHKDIYVSKTSITSAYLLYGTIFNFWQLFFSLAVTMPYGTVLLTDMSQQIPSFDSYSIILTFAWIGTAMQLFTITFWMLIAVSEKTQQFFLKIARLFYKLIKQEEKGEELYERAALYGYSLKTYTVKSLKNWKVLLVSTGFYGLGIVINTFASYTLYLGAPVDSIAPLFSTSQLTPNVFDIIVINQMTWLALEFIPIPGNIGSSEFFISEINATYLIYISQGTIDVPINDPQLVSEANALADWVTLTWRTMTYYLPIIISTPFLLHVIWSSARDKRKKQKITV